jgi:hypothetical protein
MAFTPAIETGKRESQSLKAGRRGREEKNKEEGVYVVWR